MAARVKSRQENALRFLGSTRADRCRVNLEENGLPYMEADVGGKTLNVGRAGSGNVPRTGRIAGQAVSGFDRILGRGTTGESQMGHDWL